MKLALNGQSIPETTVNIKRAWRDDIFHFPDEKSDSL